MKNLRSSLFLIATLFVINFQAQVSFTIAPSLCEGSTATLTANTGTLSALAYSWAALPSGPVFSSSSSATTTVTFPAAGTYTVGLGILTSSGFAYATNTIVINPSPTVMLSSTSTTVCSGQSSTLTASGASSYTWSPAVSLNASTGSSVIASPLSSTVYSVTGNSGGCQGTTTIALNVTISNGTIIVSSPSVCAGFTSTLALFTSSATSGYTWTGTSLSQPVNTSSVAVGAGSYSVTSNIAGCTFTGSALIGAAPPLIITVTQSSPTTCIVSNLPKYSKPVILTASGAVTYVWFPYNQATMTASLGPQNTVRPASTTCYTVTGSTAACSGSAVICVTVVPQFTIQTNVTSPTICLTETVSLSVVNIGTLAAGPSSVFTYSWTEPLNAPPISLTGYFSATVGAFPQNTCTYTIEVMDAAGCVSLPENIKVNVLPCTGLSSNSENVQFANFYPNPASDLLYITSAKKEQITIEIRDALGKLILRESKDFSGSSAAQSMRLPVPAGIYLVKISSAHGTQVGRLVKE